VSIRDEEIAWAAGLFEGEGTITQNSGIVNLRVTSTEAMYLTGLLRWLAQGRSTGPTFTPDRMDASANPSTFGCARVRRSKRFLACLSSG
jgi:hypothetical protein